MKVTCYFHIIMKISSFRTKAHLVFHWCLYKQVLPHVGEKDLGGEDPQSCTCMYAYLFIYKLRQEAWITHEQALQQGPGQKCLTPGHSCSKGR